LNGGKNDLSMWGHVMQGRVSHVAEICSHLPVSKESLSQSIHISFHEVSLEFNEEKVEKGSLSENECPGGWRFPT
jgi:riboflavin synthase alpha subunit